VAVDDAVNASMGIKTQEWYSPVAIQAYQYFGKTYGVPVEGNAVSGFVNIRMDFLKEAGAEAEKMWPPNQKKSGFESFEDMWELAKRLQKTESDGIVSRWGLSSRGWENRHLFGIMRTLGRDWWDSTQRKFFLDTPEAVEGMKLQVTRPVFDLKIETQLDTSFVEAVGAGKVAIGCGNVVLPGLHQSMGIVEDSCIYPPAVKGKKPLFVGEGGWGFVVPKQAKERDVAIEFLKYMSTYDGQKDYNAIYGGMIPAVPLVGEDPQLFPTTNYVGRAINRVAPAQWDTVYYGSDFGNPGEMEGIVSVKIDEVRGGKYKPEEACKLAQKELEDMLKRWDEEKKKKVTG